VIEVRTRPRAPRALVTPDGGSGEARMPSPAFLATRAGLVCLLIALAKLVLELPLLSRYGWHGDELYFRAAGQHLALGYVDYPPLTPALARAVEVVTGPSLFSLRLAFSLLGVVAAVAAGAIARELGAGARLQVAATVVWIATPFALGGATTPFNPTFLELAATALAMLAVTRLLVRNELRQWLLLGLWAGIGLESKYTIVVPLAAFLLGCALWRRDLLLRREAAYGLVIAAALLVPNVIWQMTHGWISLDFASTQRAVTSSDSPPLAYVAQQVLFLGAGVVLVAFGLVWLSRRPHLRPLALASGAPTAIFLVEGGRSYYALPALLPALVAGCLALAGLRRRRIVIVALAALQVAVLAAAAPLVLPILPARQLVSTGTWKLSFWKDELGWRELTAQTATAWNSRTPAERAAGTIVAVNYSMAGALSLFGPEAGLPAPLSGHLSSQYWHPARMPERNVLLVGFSASAVRSRCTSSTVLAVTDNRWHVDNALRGQQIVWCRLRAPLGQMWQRSFATARL
jgi:4-amino-4-deoxy-L-arabinose transferase-like glycosyltransferase